MARAKNRQTMNKVARERELTERRALKKARKDEKKRIAAEGDGGTGETSSEPEYAFDPDNLNNPTPLPPPAIERVNEPS